MNEETLYRRLAKIEQDQKKILTLLTEQQQPKKEWVKASEVMAATGWSVNQLRYRRRDGLVEYRHENHKFFYNINSIPSIFIRHENATTRSPGVDGAGHILGKTLKS
jgi:hypothetical protein